MFAAAAVAIAIWGATPVVTKIAVGAVDPLIVGMLRTLLAAAVTAPIVVFRHIARPRTTSETALLAGAVIALGDPEVAAAVDRRRAEQTAAVPERPSDSA